MITQFERLNAPFEHLNTPFEHLNTQFEHLETHISTLNTQFENLNTQFEMENTFEMNIEDSQIHIHVYLISMPRYSFSMWLSEYITKMDSLSLRWMTSESTQNVLVAGFFLYLLSMIVLIVNDWIFGTRRMSTKDYTLQSPLMMLRATIKMPGWWRWRWWRWSRLHTPSIGLHRGFLRGKMSPKCTWLLYGDQDKDGDERQSGQKCEMNISLKDTKIYTRIPNLYVSKN